MYERRFYPLKRKFEINFPTFYFGRTLILFLPFEGKELISKCEASTPELFKDMLMYFNLLSYGCINFPFYASHALFFIGLFYNYLIKKIVILDSYRI